MKKLVALPLVAFALAACSEIPTAPALIADGPASFDHASTEIWQAGNGNAWHGFHEPKVEWTVIGSTFIDLELSWDDDRVFDDGISPDHYSFDIRWSKDGIDWIEDEVSDPAGVAVSFTLPDLEENTEYSIEVTAIAKQGTGQSTLTHHSETAELQLSTDGASYTVVFTDVPGQGSITDDDEGNTLRIDNLNANSSSWEDVQFTIRLNGTELTTCPFAEVTVTTTFSFDGGQSDEGTLVATCAAGLYEVEIDNLAKIPAGNSASTGSMTVELDGTAVENIVDYESLVPGDGGGGGGGGGAGARR